MPQAHRIRVGSRVTIYKTDKSPYWYMDWSVDGHQYRRSTKTKSLKQARTIALRKGAELVLGVSGAPDARAPKIHQAIENYLTDAKNYV
jgi:hypothetical protein